MSKRIETFFVPWGETPEISIRETLEFLNEKREYTPGRVPQTWWENNRLSLVEVLACRTYRSGMEREHDEYTVLPYPQIHEVRWIIEMCVRY